MTLLLHGHAADATLQDQPGPQHAARDRSSRSRELDVVRGVLLFVVMLDHNDIIRNVRAVQEWFLPMTFHVAGFLVLPFLVPPRRFSAAMARDHAIRYLVPFAFALIGYALLYWAVIAPQTTPGAWVARLTTALALASPWALEPSSGFIVLWFLPALLSTVLLLALYDASSVLVRRLMVIAAVLIHLTVGSASTTMKTMAPQGVLIALYIFPLGLLARHVIPPLAATRRMSVLCLAALVLIAMWWRETGVEIEVATLIVPTFLQPDWVLATDLSDLSFFLALLICAPVLARLPGLALLGRFSLLCYLLHPLIYKPVLAVIMRLGGVELLSEPGGAVRYWGGAAASVAVVAAISLATAASLQAWPLFRGVVTPRGYDDWWIVSGWSAGQSRRA